MNHKKTISEMWGAECAGRMLITVTAYNGVWPDKFPPVNRPCFPDFLSLYSVFGPVR